MNETKSIELFESFDDVLTIKDLRQALKIGRNKAYQLLHDNNINYIKIGNRYRIPKINVINYIKNK